MLDDIKKQICNIEVRFEGLRGLLKLEKKQKEIGFIEELMSASDFWDNTDKSNKMMKELKYLKGCVEPFIEGSKKVEEFKELAELSEDDEELLTQIQEEINVLEEDIDKTELQIMLSGPFDKNNAILSINAGAGGTESCDWASMLMRMYSRWTDSCGHTLKVLDELNGDEVGIKSVTLSIEGEMVYGHLKGEKGVHRLVRISPFDSNKRRHTSFASVDVIPEIEDDIEVDINTEDLRIDIFRSSGPGGQSVNTTDSAVRITHVPTGTVAQCQNERSQLSNRQTAMKILRARLYEKKQKEQEAEMAKEYGQKQKIEWGSQIRSYVMHPYSMVKDHRTNVETSNVVKVMDGGLEEFIEGFLRWRPEARG